MVAGDVRGKFKSLLKRVATVNDKSGPFDYLLCVGDLFGTSEEEWNQVKNGKLNFPITTYFLGPNDDAQSPKYSGINDTCTNLNISYLGKRGIFTTSNGLRIAYVSGRNEGTSESTFSDNDVLCVRDVCLRGQANFKGVDILLTSAWPCGVSKLHNKAVSKLNVSSVKVLKSRTTTFIFCALRTIIFRMAHLYCPG